MHSSSEGRGVALALLGEAASLAKSLIPGLRHTGAQPVVLTDNPDGLGEMDATHTLRVDGHSRTSWHESLGHAERQVGPLSLVIHCALPAPACVPATFVGLPHERWTTSCKLSLTGTLRLLQAV